MVNYSQAQWQRCKWDMRKWQSGTIFKEFPDLENIFGVLLDMAKDYSNKDNNSWRFDMVIAYIILTYHRWSPFAINEQNIVQRKLAVCEFLKIDTKVKYTEVVMTNKVRFITIATILFLKTEESMDWIELQVLLESYYQSMASLMSNDELMESKESVEVSTKKYALLKNFKAVKKEIQELSEKVFRDDTDLLNYMEKYKAAESEKFVVLSPEDYVKSKAK